MTGSDRAVLLCVSSLLRYPDEGFTHCVEDVDALFAVLPEDSASVIRHFLGQVERQGLYAMQEEHVRTFDLERGCSPYLAWHRYGDDSKQGRALAAFQELYADAGFEPLQDELPDYLPMVLEFLGVCPDWASSVVQDGFGEVLGNMSEHMTALAPETPYAPLLRLVVERLAPQPPLSMPLR